ncbi:hypothetical protein ACO0LL_30075 [Undibacterium sp. TC4M20W]|uniref:hypothetical protein n=1 Tax=Undibacterium sp. TC4M20W TaxID=3413052 RepID=UPI003BF00558
MQIVKKLIPRWKTQHRGVRPGNSKTEITAVFARLACKPTSDVSELYSMVGGLEVMDNDAFWRLWPLTEILERNTETSPYGILFSDHLIDSWAYRLKYETDARSSVYIDYFNHAPSPIKIFDGLEEFLIAYEENPNVIIKLPPAKPEVYCWGASKALVTLDPPKGGYSPNFIWS